MTTDPRKVRKRGSVMMGRELDKQEQGKKRVKK